MEKELDAKETRVADLERQLAAAAGGGGSSKEAEALRQQLERMQEAFADELESVVKENEDLRAQLGGGGGADVGSLRAELAAAVKSRDELQRQVDTLSKKADKAALLNLQKQVRRCIRCTCRQAAC